MVGGGAGGGGEGDGGCGCGGTDGDGGDGEGGIGDGGDPHYTQSEQTLYTGRSVSTEPPNWDWQWVTKV